MTPLMSLSPVQLHEALALLAQGAKQSQVASRYQVSAPTLCRLLAKFRETGSVEQAVAKQYATGPRDEHELTPDEGAALKLAMLQKRSRRLAAEVLASHAACTQATFERLAEIFDRAAEARVDESWPAWFRRACILTDEERLSFLGPKHLAAIEPARPRGLFYETADGAQHLLFANAVWEFDDESENTPWVELDEHGRARVNRQTLKAIDVYASFYLGMKAVSRNSDGYRVEDQADFLLELVDAHGLPLRARIERGPWDNRFWWGLTLPRQWRMSDADDAYRFGGIDTSAGGPIGVIECFKSRHKGTIEGSFNHRQDLAAHETLDIGRSRGEHEAAAKHLTRAYANQADAIARFPEAAARADISAEVLARFNGEAKRRRHLFGSKKVVPAELYADAVKRPLAAADRWRFLPVKVAATVRNYHIQVKVKEHELPFIFTAEGFAPAWDWHGYLPHGWRVFAVFHPHRLDLGCFIFNALHPDHADNPARFPLGMPLGVLPAAERAPQFSDAPRDFADRKRTLAAIRSETRITKASSKGIRVSTVVAAGQLRSRRQGAPDPLLNLDSGAPPAGVLETSFLERAGDSRSVQTENADRLTGDRGHPAGQTACVTGHGTTRHAQGSFSNSAARLAELEAALND
jgi:transposase